MNLEDLRNTVKERKQLMLQHRISQIEKEIIDIAINGGNSYIIKIDKKSTINWMAETIVEHFKDGGFKVYEYRTDELDHHICAPYISNYDLETNTITNIKISWEL